MRDFRVGCEAGFPLRYTPACEPSLCPSDGIFHNRRLRAPCRIAHAAARSIEDAADRPSPVLPTTVADYVSDSANGK